MIGRRRPTIVTTDKYLDQNGERADTPPLDNSILDQSDNTAGGELLNFRLDMHQSSGTCPYIFDLTKEI